MAEKIYSSSVDYEKKLKCIMDKFGVSSFIYDWTRSDCFIEFVLNGQLYRFEHSISKAREAGLKIQWVSDLFAQLVLTLEDLSRMQKRGLYKLDVWLHGMKGLPAPDNALDIPRCFIALGFESIPTMEQLKKRYRDLSKVSHPDKGGNPDLFGLYSRAYELAVETLEKE